jgi:hypothetical protein
MVAIVGYGRISYVVVVFAIGTFPLNGSSVSKIETNAAGHTSPPFPRCDIKKLNNNHVEHVLPELFERACCMLRPQLF